MRFVCDSCRAQYMISDDKIGAKGVKVRCKKCGHVITVRTSGATVTKEDAPESAEAAPAAESKARGDSATPGLPASVGTPPEGGLFTDVEEDEIGAVFDQVLNSGSHKIPAGEPVGEAAEKKSASEAILKLSEAEAEEESKTPASAHEWFVAIDEKQVGPLTVEKVKDHWERGEVSPDSLCWRSGFSDWIPLSEATELASVLSPRPSSKPVIVAPAAISTSTPTVQAPVESAFSAGNASRTSSRADIPLAASAATEEPSGWKPSAASVLASLVKEEDEALSRPAPAPEPVAAPVARTTSLLDIPMPEATPPAPAAPLAAMPLQAPVMAPPPAAAAPAPYAQQPAAPYAPPAAPYAPPGYPAYPPPAAAPPSGNKMAVFGASAAVALLGLGGGVVYMMTRPSTPPVPSGAVAVAEPVQPPAPPAVKPAEALPLPPPPTAVVQTPPAGTQPPAATPTPPPAATGTPAAQGTAVATGGTQTPPPAPVAEPVKPAEPPKTATARVEPSEPKTPPKKSGGTSASGDSEPVKVARNETRSKPDAADDEFDELFGTPKKPSKPTESAEPKRTSTYIPPEPGTSKVQERLAQSDVMQVVLNNKPAIVKCVNEQKKKDPTISGKLVMRWNIQTSGKTSAIACQSPEFKSTYMAKCIGDLIKTWNFPKHQKPGDPIVFPFTF